MSKMYTNKRNSNNSDKIGHNAQELFGKLLKKKYPPKTVRKSTKEEDIKEHWDWMVKLPNKNVRIEVKSMKRKKRWDKNFTDDIWIEFIGITGHNGWLYGKADIIAFERPDYFVLVNRKRLAKLSESLVGYTRQEINISLTEQYPELYKLYNRKGRQDVMTLIQYKDILTIATKKLLK